MLKLYYNSMCTYYYYYPYPIYYMGPNKFAVLTKIFK